MILETYTKKNTPLTMSEMLKGVNYSKHQLVSLSVVQYPNEIIANISHATGKSESIIWYDLLVLENNNQVVKITNAEELYEAIDSRKPYIYIPDSIRTEQQRLINSVLTEKDRLGFELGSAGTGNILAEIIYQITLRFENKSQEYQQMKSKLRRYYVKSQDERGTLLYEKEQTY